MTWQWIAFNATLIVLTVWAIWIAEHWRAAAQTSEHRETFYRDYADSLMAAERWERTRRVSVERRLREAEQRHTETAGQLMELQTLVDGAIGQGAYPPNQEAWAELRSHVLAGERSPMFGNVRPLRPFGA